MVDRIDTSRMLLELRAMAAEASRLRAEPATASQGVPEFGKVLQTALDRVNEMQSNATQLAVAFERGEPGVDLPRVMVETQKASLAFRAVSEVRNKLITAYQEIKNMPI